MTHAADSSYGRLSSAWLGVSAALLTRGREPNTRASSPAHAFGSSGASDGLNGCRAPRVLVARQGRCLPDTFYCGLAASSEHEDRIYRIDPCGATSLEDVWRQCQANEPRILLVDIHLLVAIQPARDPSPKDPPLDLALHLIAVLQPRSKHTARLLDSEFIAGETEPRP